MINDESIKKILLEIANNYIDDWPKKPKFEIICNSLLCAALATVPDGRRIQIAAFKKSEIDDYLTSSHYPVESRIRRSLLRLQRKFYVDKKSTEHPMHANGMVVPVGITIDTNVINAKCKLKAMNKLEAWHDQEKIQLLVNDIMEEELTIGSIQYRKQGKYIFQCLKPNRNYPKVFEKFREMLFPTVVELNERQKKDIDHIIAHQKHSEDIFVTNDQNFIRQSSKLKGENIIIMTPEECIDFLRKNFGWI